MAGFEGLPWPKGRLCQTSPKSPLVTPKSETRSEISVKFGIYKVKVNFLCVRCLPPLYMCPLFRHARRRGGGARRHRALGYSAPARSLSCDICSWPNPASLRWGRPLWHLCSCTLLQALLQAAPASALLRSAGITFRARRRSTRRTLLRRYRHRAHSGTWLRQR